jgi:hypothetical protein
LLSSNIRIVALCSLLISKFFFVHWVITEKRTVVGDSWGMAFLTHLESTWLLAVLG